MTTYFYDKDLKLYYKCSIDNDIISSTFEHFYNIKMPVKGYIKFIISYLDNDVFYLIDNEKYYNVCYNNIQFIVLQSIKNIPNYIKEYINNMNVINNNDLNIFTKFIENEKRNYKIKNIDNKINIENDNLISNLNLIDINYKLLNEKYDLLNEKQNEINLINDEIINIKENIIKIEKDYKNILNNIENLNNEKNTL